MRLPFAITLVALSCSVTAAAVLGSQRPSSQVADPVATSAPPHAQSGPVEAVSLARYRALLRSRAVPELVIAGRPVTDSVNEFLERVSISAVDEREPIRAAIARNAKNPEVVKALAATVFDGSRDFTRRLTALGVLGELRHPDGEAALTQFVRLPLPTQGHMIEGEIAESISLQQLQMKAVDGLAYAGTATGDAEVLRLVKEHPSRAVRAEAIEAYLFNHGYSAAARQALARVLRPEERAFLDRPHLLPGISAAAFNAQLASFLRLHPELQPAPPARAVVNEIDRARDQQKDGIQRTVPRLPAPPQI
jgi:hypothetical protein